LPLPPKCFRVYGRNHHQLAIFRPDPTLLLSIYLQRSPFSLPSARSSILSITNRAEKDYRRRYPQFNPEPSPLRTPPLAKASRETKINQSNQIRSDQRSAYLTDLFLPPSIHHTLHNTTPSSFSYLQDGSTALIPLPRGFLTRPTSILRILFLLFPFLHPPIHRPYLLLLLTRGLLLIRPAAPASAATQR
jgi:hypothetical protein